MKNLTTILLISLFSTTATFGQVETGEIDDLEVFPINISQVIPDTSCFPCQTVLVDSIDLTGDGTYDLVASSSVFQYPDNVTGNTRIEVLNPDLEFIVDSFWVANLDVGEIIDVNDNWMYVNASAIASTGIGIAGSLTAGNFLVDTDGYLGFRVQENGGYQYGWILVINYVTESSASLHLPTVAIQSMPNSVAELPSIPVTIYPNPASNHIFLGTEIGGNKAHLHLINTMGQVVLEKEITHNSPIDIQHLAPGIYQVLVTTKDNRYRQQLVVH